jgi:hypothetical protein
MYRKENNVAFFLISQSKVESNLLLMVCGETDSSAPFQISRDKIFAFIKLWNSNKSLTRCYMCFVGFVGSLRTKYFLTNFMICCIINGCLFRLFIAEATFEQITDDFFFKYYLALSDKKKCDHRPSDF